MGREIAVSAFKARCLALVEEVSQTGQELVITKRGKPLARILPMAEPPSLSGSVTLLVSEEELLTPIDARWDAAP